jgi:hypothetical protein
MMQAIKETHGVTYQLRDEASTTLMLREADTCEAYDGRVCHL